MSLRIRQVKPDFWADAKLADLPDATRLFYVGLWMTADDTGWLRWDVATVAADLYRFEGRRPRERRVAAMMARLVDHGRVVIHPCGHAFIPKLTAHQRFSSMEKRVRTIEREHLETCHSRETAGNRGSSTTERNVKERNVTGGDGGGNGQKTDEENVVTEFRLKVPKPA